MKLVHINSGLEFLKWEENSSPEFADPILSQAMSQFGIIIPEALRIYFGGKERVYREDPEFLKAFKELYFEREMDPNLYEWR